MRASYVQVDKFFFFFFFLVCSVPWKDVVADHPILLILARFTALLSVRKASSTEYFHNIMARRAVKRIFAYSPNTNIRTNNTNNLGM